MAQSVRPRSAEPVVVHELRARSHDWVLACGSHQGQRLTRRTQRPNGWQQPRPLAKNSKKPLQNGRRPWMDHTKEGLAPGCGQHPVNADLREAWIFARCATSSATALRVAASDIPSGSTGGAIYDRPQGAVQVQGRILLCLMSTKLRAASRSASTARGKGLGCSGVETGAARASRVCTGRSSVALGLGSEAGLGSSPPAPAG